VTEPLQKAFAELEAVYAKIDALTSQAACQQCGECCRFEEFGHRLYTTLVEALYLVDRSGLAADCSEASHCAYLDGSKCLAREGRTLGCRTFFCDQVGVENREAHEDALAAIKSLSAAGGIPVDYKPLHVHLAAFESCTRGEDPAEEYSGTFFLDSYRRER
jgi:hypothetical protein